MSLVIAEEGTPIISMDDKGRWVFYHRASRIAHNVPFDLWQVIGEHLSDTEDALPFLMGDWLNYGMTEFKKEDKWAQGIPEHWDRKIPTLNKYAWVCSKVHPLLRLKLSQEFPPHALTFTHYEKVASLDKFEQESFLRDAALKGHSARKLAGSVRTYKRQKKEAGEGDEPAIIMPTHRTLRLAPGPDYDPDELAEDVLLGLEGLEQSVDGARITNVEVEMRLYFEQVI